MKRAFFIVLLTVFVSCHPSKTKQKQVVVFCAASLTDVMMDIKAAYEKESSTIIKLNIASSGTLARQIEQGAEPGVFISANKRWLDYISLLEKTEKDTETKVAGNSLVLIAPIENKRDTIIIGKGFDLSSEFKGRLSIGDPDYVPAGSYSKQALEYFGCWKNIQNRILPAKDVRSALMVVELGEVELGIVYKTDALKSKKVKIIGEIPNESHRAIFYYAAILKGLKDRETTSFFRYLNSEKSKIIWEEYGFLF